MRRVAASREHSLEKKHHRPKLLVLASIAVLSIVGTACGGVSSGNSTKHSSSGASTTAANTTSRSATSSTQAATAPNNGTVARPAIIWQPGDEQPFYYANGHQVWAKFNLAPKEIEVDQGTAELSAMASGSADFALLGPGPFVSGLSHGIPMVAIMPNVDFKALEGLYVAPNSGITNLRSLVGHSVAVPFGSSADTGLKFALSKEGISPSKIHIENDSPNAILAGFLRHSINAAYIWSTWGERMLAGGAKLVSTDASAGVDAGPTLLAVRKAYLKAHPNVVARVVAVLGEGGSGATTSPASVAPALAKATGDTPSEALTIAKEEKSLTIADALSPSGADSFVNQSSGVSSILVKIAAQLKGEGLITKAPNDIPASVITGPLEAAQKLLAAKG